jgi:ElaB/YqjD/DUF883 family membrane-anchored ribosome-binding protein
MQNPNSTDPQATSTSQPAELGQKVASAIDSAAASLRDKTGSMPGGDKVAGAANTAADAMESVADYVRDQDLRSMLSDAQQIVRQHPGATLLTAAAIGFLLARSLSRD